MVRLGGQGRGHRGGHRGASQRGHRAAREILESPPWDAEQKAGPDWKVQVGYTWARCGGKLQKWLERDVHSERVPCSSLSLHGGQLCEEIRWEKKWSLTYGTDVRRHFLASIRNEEGGGDQLWIEHSMTWSQTASDKWKLGNPDTGILLKSAVKGSSGGGFEMEVDSGSHRKLNVFFPLAFTLNLSHFSFETRTVWKGISFFPDYLSLILRTQQLWPY